MTSMREDLERKRHHQQPRMRCDFTAPGFVHPEPQPPADCVTCGGAGVIDTSPPTVDQAPWLASDTTCSTCNGTGEEPPACSSAS